LPGGYRQQAMLRFQIIMMARNANHLAVRQPGERRDLAKCLGGRTFNGGQKGDIALLSQA